MPNRVLKHSYTVPCASPFRDAVETLADRRKVNVGDLARSILLVVPPEMVAAFCDPGEPPIEDRETVVLKSGPAASAGPHATRSRYSLYPQGVSPGTGHG